MRLFSALRLLGAVALGATAAIAKKDDSDDVASTTFDGIEVPPMLSLTPKNFEDQLNNTKVLVVKSYNPNCHHCKKFAPIYQTLYEYYYTEKQEDGASTTDHFNLKFGYINCLAFNDLCYQHDIQSYPTTTVYADGKKVVDIRGVKNQTILTHHIEGALDQAYPGVRPAKLLLPAVGATSRPHSEEEATEILDKVLYARIEEEKANKGKKGKDKAHDKANEGKDAPVAKKPEDAAEKVVAGKDGGASMSTSTRKAKSKGSPTMPVYQGPPVPTTAQNPNGISVPLAAESFLTQVTMSQEPWFIKFYAPWCHHCKAMAANWEQLAKAMQGKLNIGEVNCEKESRLCKDVKVKGYPTIVFFRGGERIEYDGLRGLGDFVDYAEKTLNVVGGVQNVDKAAFEALEAKEEVIFLYFYDFATTGEDFMALDRLPLSLIGHARLVKTNDPALYERFKITTWPRLVVSREGRTTYYPPLTPHEMRDTRQVLNWMKSVWLPIVPELTASNAREIMDGKLVVLGILKREDEEGFASATREMKSAASEWMDKQIQLFQLERQELRDAKQLRIEEAEDRNDQRALRAAKSIRVNMDRADKKEVTFAWVDGAFWQRWVRSTYGVDTKDGERVIINDEDNRRYWDLTSTGNPILPSRTSILETLNKVTASPPKIRPKLTISAIEKVLFDIRNTFSEHPYLSTGCVLGMSLGIASWLRGRVRRSGRGHFRLDEGVNMRDFKLPTLGGVAMNGKND